MPIYNFACDKCGERFETMAKMGQQTKKCPKCGASAKQVPSVPSQFQWGNK